MEMNLNKLWELVMDREVRWSQRVEVSRVIWGFLGGSVVICLQCRIPG